MTASHEGVCPPFCLARRVVCGTAKRSVLPPVNSGLTEPRSGCLNFPAWRVSRLSESPCTETGLRWQVFRVSESACRQFDTATRKTCRRNPETRARRRSNSGNLPRWARNAARRPANSENLPIRGWRLRQLGKHASCKRETCTNPENLPFKERPAAVTRKTCRS